MHELHGGRRREREREREKQRSRSVEVAERSVEHIGCDVCGWLRERGASAAAELERGGGVRARESAREGVALRHMQSMHDGRVEHIGCDVCGWLRVRAWSVMRCWCAMVRQAVGSAAPPDDEMSEAPEVQAEHAMR